MKITVCGAAGFVTGSCYLIEAGKERVLVDCGMFQGTKEVTRLNYEAFRFDPRKISYVLLTHAHIDHSGLIPKLVAEGFRGRIFATKATADLCRIMLEDSGNLQEAEAEEENRRREREGLPPRRPLYTPDDAKAAMPYFSRIEYNRTYSLFRDIQFRFLDAGHIIGAAIIELYVTEHGSTKKIVFSGDVGQWNSTMVNDPTIVEEADHVFLESTYGERLHDDIETRDDILLGFVRSAYKKRGKLLIPSFAVERTQEILYAFNRMIKEKKFPEEKVFIDSPLALKAIEVFEKNKGFMKKTAYQHGDPFNFKKLVYSESTQDSKEINEYDRPCIVIAGNGMATGGRIVHHLKHGLWNQKNTVLFVGFQAEGTTGREIVEGADRVRIMGSDVVVKAEIGQMNSFSAHSDYEGLLKWINGFVRKPKEVYLVHGEPGACEAMKKRLRKQGYRCMVPQLGESIEI